MKRKSDHIIIKNVNRGYELECLHCGEKYEPALPCPMDIFLSICRTFNTNHKHCKAESTSIVKPG